MSLPHKGTETAALIKKVSKNIPEKFAAPNRVSTKNKNNVEVMATGLAFKNAKNKKLRVLLSLKKLRTLTCERILGT